MAREFLRLSPTDVDPPIGCNRGVSLVPQADWQRHAPDLRLLAVERGSLTARCSCWWYGTATANGRRLGIIGHYAAADAEAGITLLARACDALAEAGCQTVAGPMDGSTWRRYRLVTERGAEPMFFLEPDNPLDWPSHWSGAGFSPMATYTSAVNDDLTVEDSRTAAAVSQLTDAGISIRAFDPSRPGVELHRIFTLSCVGFARNFLYTPISEWEFLEQYSALLPLVHPELILLAEKDGALVGFMFAVPDMLEARRRGTVDTVILKTMVVHPSLFGMGVGGVLMDLVQRRARQLGFRRSIHAMIHEANVSRRISDRYARTIRRYALFSRSLFA